MCARRGERWIIMRAERIVPNPSTSPGAAARPANSAAAEHADGAVNTNARGKIGELESVRGVAALLIVFYHMPVWHGALYGLKFVRNSYLMVDLFFVLSGFVINLNYGERLTSAKSLGRFQLLRLGRLYPVHLIFLLLFLLLETGKWVAATKYNVTAPTAGRSKRTACTRSSNSCSLSRRSAYHRTQKRSIRRAGRSA